MPLCMTMECFFSPPVVILMVERSAMGTVFMVCLKKGQGFYSPVSPALYFYICLPGGLARLPARLIVGLSWVIPSIITDFSENVALTQVWKEVLRLVVHFRLVPCGFLPPVPEHLVPSPQLSHMDGGMCVRILTSQPELPVPHCGMTGPTERIRALFLISTHRATISDSRTGFFVGVVDSVSFAVQFALRRVGAGAFHDFGLGGKNGVVVGFWKGHDFYSGSGA